MNAGLPQGFVRFGTVAHTILVHIHEQGVSSHINILDQCDVDSCEIGMNLTRLRCHGFIESVGRIDGYEHKCRTQQAYMIVGSGECPFKKFKNKTAVERTQKYRRSLKLRVNTVFDFRGTLDIKVKT